MANARKTAKAWANDSYDAFHDVDDGGRWRPSRRDNNPAMRPNFKRPASSSSDENRTNWRERTQYSAPRRDVFGQRRNYSYSSSSSTRDGSARRSSCSSYDRFDEHSDNESVASARDDKSYRLFHSEKKRFACDESRARNAPKEKHFGYRYLEQQLRKETPSIIAEVLKVNSPFGTYLEKTELQADWLFMIMRILKVICETEYKGNKTALLNKVAESKLLHAIQFYLGEACFEKNDGTISNMSAFISDLITFYAAVIEIIPSVALDKDFKRIVMKTEIAVDQIKNNLPSVVIEQSSISKMDVLKAKIDDYEKALAKEAPSQMQKRTRMEQIADSAPPESFRELSLYPTYDDLMKSNLGFVRPNKIKGAYDDVEHYLDVQFRLLREDFIDPLRRGIRNFMAANTSAGRCKFKYDNVRFYPNSAFTAVETNKSNVVGFVLDFDPNHKLRKIRWEYNRRFMHGSLLLFTSDNFASFFYATVLERDVEMLSKGRILVSLTSNAKTDENFFNVKFLMVESEVFFEPYHLVMKMLRTLNEENFPMRKYIVDGRNKRDYPSYLYELTGGYILDGGIRQPGSTIDYFDDEIAPRLDNGDVFGDEDMPQAHPVDDRFIIHPFDDSSWPSAEKLRLDTYQHEAFKTALTSEFAIIQGPPGTGKTFLGLKIVRTLLRNKKKPILVVCYTNHALDQFLEGILHFTKRIVRVGGQSRSEIMQRYNLRGRSNLSHLRGGYPSLLGTIAAIREEIKKYRERIDLKAREKRSIEKPFGILRFDRLAPAMLPHHRTWFKDDQNLIEWLFRNEDDAPIVDATEDDVEFGVDEGDDDDVVDVTAMEERVATQKAAEEVETENDDLYDDDIDNIRNFGDDDEAVFGVLDTIELKNELIYSLTVDYLVKMSEDMMKAYKEIKRDGEYHMPYLEQQYRLKQLRMQLHSLQSAVQKLRENLSNPALDKNRAKIDSKRHDLATIPVKYRWNLYWQWVSILRSRTIVELNKLETIYRMKMAQYEEYRQMEDLAVVKVADVVGMTTTGAARLQILLKQLNPAVVIVEEAAEVLEAHIVASLTQKCEHVILIGDHKQLKPSAAVYELCKKYNIDVSLFERMINNEMYCPRLNVQHRMRPEIARLISPSVYPELMNHEDVTKYESIKGVKKNTNLFFVTHNNFELVEDDSMTKKNPFEAEFMIQLARYLILQGYSPSSITILTTYAGQMFLLRELKKNDRGVLREVRCIVVDKYQGEENEIVLLSLVRSNEEGKVGFLNIQNRVCVALSRAKKALYMIGNMEMLAKCDLWAGVKQVLEDQQAIGDALQLYCERHDKYTSVAKAADFGLVREGGCALICGELLPCGHNCKSLCHTINRDHAEMSCREACTKTCPRMHPCDLQCFQKCRPCVVLVERVLPCGHHKRLACHIDEAVYACQVLVDDVLPLCGHPVTRKCCENVEKAKCNEPCVDRLDCGHACRRRCHKYHDPNHIEYKCRQPCEKMNKNCQKAHKCQKACFEECGQCSIMETFQLICGHNHKLSCSTDLAEVKCFSKCEKTCADCKKPCRKLCHEDCSPCKNKVKKEIPECGHTVTIECHSTPVRAMCRKKCESVMACGHRCRADCCKPCNLEKCLEFVESSDVKPLCGHDYVKVPCYRKGEVGSMKLEEFLPNCDVPCDVLLKCGDPCGGSCGKCWQGRLHFPCQKECGAVLVCGHTCANPCRQLCPPCGKPCRRECVHSKCPRKCGMPCAPCQEKCEWRCKHQKCTRKCGAYCNRSPCYEPCRKKLACGHPCVGFCGEPCPPVCRVCNPEITEIMFGYEDEEDARFVYLVDCQHTIESRAMEQHLSTSAGDDEIVMKVCPLCKTPINCTLRFSSYVKETYKHIANIQKTIYGHENSLIAVRLELTDELETLHRHKAKLNSLGLESLAEIVREYLTAVRLERSNRLQRSNRSCVSQMQLDCVRYYCKVASVVTSRIEDLYLAKGIKHDRVKLTTPQYDWRSGLRVTRTVTQTATTLYTNDEAVAAVGKAVELTNLLTKRIAQTMWTINDQQICDFNDELRRFNKIVDFSVCLVHPNYRLYRDDVKVAAIRQKIDEVVYGIRKFSENDEKTAETLFKELEVELKSPKPLTSQEKSMIHAAMSVEFHSAQKSGHWYKCSNGHYYCITECGGAMQVGKCPDCGEKIGGSSHQTVSTSRLATDMDGARYPAWSTAANMQNYRFY